MSQPGDHDFCVNMFKEVLIRNQACTFFVRE